MHAYQIYTQFRALAVKYVIRITFYWLFCSNNEVKCKQSRSKQWGHPELFCFIPSLIFTKSEQLHRECNEVCLCCSKQDLIWHGYQCTPSAQTENMLHLLWTFLHPPFKHKQGNDSHAEAMLGTCCQNVCSMTASPLLSDWHALPERWCGHLLNEHLLTSRISLDIRGFSNPNWTDLFCGLIICNVLVSFSPARC